MRSKSNKTAIAVIAALAVLDALVWIQIVSGAPKNSEEIHFLDVGQGDAVLTMLPGGVKILTDAGPDSRIRRSLQEVLSSGSCYIDLAVISHSQADHFGGFKELLRGCDFGAFIWNGRGADENPGWQELMDKIRERKIPLIVLGKNDNIRMGDAVLKFISPNRALLQSAELNDTALVQMLQTLSFGFLSVADVGLEVEKQLSREYDLRADVLKVGHHGSKYSSGEEFLADVRPRLTIISAGLGNRYGHPAPEALARLKSAGAAIFRTDQNGTISVIAQEGKLKIFTEK